MPVIRPFKALRAAKDKVEQVSADTSQIKNNELLIKELGQNPNSYLHVVKPYLHFPDEPKNPEKHYPFGKEYMDRLEKDGILIRDEKDSLYIYSQQKLNGSGDVFTGIIVTAWVEDYIQNRIKKHENTRTIKENALAKHILLTEAMGEPVLLTYPAQEGINEIIGSISKETPDYEFVTNDTLRHRVWVVSDGDVIESLVGQFAQVPSFYIADGHHRSAAACVFALEKRKTQQSIDSPSDYFLSYLIPDDQLKIVAFHRLVKDFEAKDWTGLIEGLKSHFSVEKLDVASFLPETPHQFGMYFDKTWYRLDFLRENLKVFDVLNNLDVSILENFILKTHLNINDSKTDSRLAYLDGTKGTGVLMDMVDRGEFSIAFTLFPTSINEVLAVADLGFTMPPKSTYIEPKLRTGLIIQKF